MSAQTRRLVSGGSKESKCGVSAASAPPPRNLTYLCLFTYTSKRQTAKVSVEEM